MKEFGRALDAHAAKDERALTAIEGQNGTQTVMLTTLQKSVDRLQKVEDVRATTEIELAGQTRGWIRKGLIGLAFIIIGWLLHRAGVG